MEGAVVKVAGGPIGEPGAGVKEGLSVETLEMDWSDPQKLLRQTRRKPNSKGNTVCLFLE